MTEVELNQVSESQDSKPKHTPGPWETSRDAVPAGHVQVTVYEARTEKRVATVFEREANAQLIAAAPDLLAALVTMNHMGGDERGGYCICPKKDGSAPDAKHATVCVNARAAIAKAEGR